MTQTPFDADTLPDAADHATVVFKKFANVMRLRLLLALREGPQSVSALQEVLGATQPAVSLQLLRMRNDGLVTCYRSDADARIMLYAVADARALALVDMAAAL